MRKVAGEAGNFTVEILKEPRYIDEDKCTACGTCTMYCPRPVVDWYNERLEVTRAPHIDYAQAIPASYYIDAKACLRINHETCNLCAQTCTAGAIDFSQRPRTMELNVGSIVLTPGFGRIDDDILRRFGYGVYPDVVTSLEFERLTCASGPTEGHIVRPSDEKTPKKVAFLQCIGSRDESCGNGFCSTVCCMYAIKEASVAKEHEPDLDITLFFMDIRTMGKGFDAFREEAVKKYGFNIVRARVPKVEEVDGRLVLNYVEEDGTSKSDVFDMVVLSVGLSPPEDAEIISEKTGIELNQHSFCKTTQASPLSTTVDGVYVAGAFQGPKDIPESVTQASGVAANVSELLKEARGTRAVTVSYPDEDKALMEEEPRIGVFVCHCGVNIAGVVDVKAVRDYAGSLPNVVLYEDTLYSCSQDALKHIAERIRDERLNRVVIAACSPRTHEPLFQETLRSIGLNPALIEMANIRDQCAWVHAQEPEAATEKSKDLVRMAVAKARLLEPLQQPTVDVTPCALVIGGGASGMTAALSIADQGYKVVLVEREKELGGNLRRLGCTFDGEEAKKVLNSLITDVKRHKLIEVMISCEVKNVSGYIGNFTTTVEHNGKSELINHGVIVVATGGREYKPKGYLYGDSDRVLTQLELEARLSKGKSFLRNASRVVMIQCVGSRGEDMSHCSKICCTQAVKNALKLKEARPELDVFILYGDMRTYGLYEDMYREARLKGIKFIRFDADRRPEVVKKSRGLSVKVFDKIIGEELEIPASYVVLSVGISPAANEGLSQMLKAPLTKDGFFLEAHAKLRPVEVAVDGVYICGLSHGAKGLEESIAQAKAAASKAVIPLAKGKVSVAPIVSHVDEKKCIGCGICASLCPFSAIELIKVDKKRKARTITASCKGCGICASHCPTIAISMGGFTDEAIFAQIHAFGQGLEQGINEEN